MILYIIWSSPAAAAHQQVGGNALLKTPYKHQAGTQARLSQQPALPRRHYVVDFRRRATTQRPRGSQPVVCPPRRSLRIAFYQEVVGP